MNVEFEVHGLQELDRRLAALPVQIEKKLGRQALRAGAKILQRHIKATLPVDLKTPDGVHLNKSVAIYRKRADRARLKVSVGYVGLARTYGHIIEFGGVRVQPQPIWRQAVSAVGNQVVQTVVRKLVTDLDKYAAKQRT